MILEILLNIFFALLIVICVLWVVVGIYSTYKEGLHEERIEQLERYEKLIKKITYDYDTEPMRNEEGRMTRVPTCSSEAFLPNQFREECGLSPIKVSDKRGEFSMTSCKDLSSSFDCVPGDRVCVRFFDPVIDDTDTYHVIGLLVDYEKYYGGSGKVIIRLDDGRCVKSSLDLVSTIIRLSC